jgi:hypothetical protein
MNTRKKSDIPIRGTQTIKGRAKLRPRGVPFSGADDPRRSSGRRKLPATARLAFESLEPLAINALEDTLRKTGVKWASTRERAAEYVYNHLHGMPKSTVGVGGVGADGQPGGRLEVTFLAARPGDPEARPVKLRRVGVSGEVSEEQIGSDAASVARATAAAAGLSSARLDVEE